MLDSFTIQSLDTQEFWIYLILAGGIAGFALYRGLKSIARARLIENTPTSKIRSAPQGYVEIVGHCKAPLSGKILSPLTNTDCVWYRYSVEKKNDKSWNTVKSGMSTKPILCDDGTDICAIFPNNIHASINNRNVWYGSTPLVTGISPLNFGGGRFRYTEELLLQNEQIYCLGNFTTLNEPLTDGRSENPVMPTQTDPPTDELEIRHTLSEPKDSAPFLLSNNSQSRLVSSTRRGGWFGIVIFFIAGSVAVRLLFSRFIS